MPQRFFGLIGYVGERIVRQYLEETYASDQHEIVEQIIPATVGRKGGGYLDFGVLKNGNVEYVYEVKCQDYILDKGFQINKALLYLWENPHSAESFYIQEESRECRSKNFQRAYLVSLAGPNEDFIKKHGIHNCANIILFSEVLDRISIDIESLFLELQKDTQLTIDRIRKPLSGKLVNASFIKKRKEYLQTDDQFNRAFHEPLSLRY